MSTEQLKKIFDEFDLDKSGTISLQEIGAVAQKLGEALNAEQLSKIKKTLDTNNDGQISFSQFQQWWKMGQKGKMMQLVKLKAKAMKMTNLIENKFSQANINLENHKGNSNPDKIDVRLEFGEPENECVHIGFSFYSRGKGEKSERQKIKMMMGNMGGQINQNTVGFAIKLPSKNPSEAKVAFEKLLNQTLVQEGSPIQDIGDNPFFCYKSEANEKDLLLSVMTRQQIQSMAAPMMQTTQEVLSAIGEDFYAFSHVDFTINTTIDNILDGNMVNNLMKGFSFKLYTQANQSALGKVRKLAQKTQKDTPALINLLTLIRSKKFHLKIRSPKQMQLFMKKMGISEAIEGLPCLADLLQEMSGQMMSEDMSANPLFPIIQKVSRFALKNVENNVEIYILLGQIGTIRLVFNAKNITRIHSILFNEA